MKKYITSTILLLGLCFSVQAQTRTYILKPYNASPNKYQQTFVGFTTTMDANGIGTIVAPVVPFTLSGNLLYPTSTSYSLGIGNTSPTATLDVNGTFRYRGGSSGQVLVNTGSGNATWQTAPVGTLQTVTNAGNVTTTDIEIKDAGKGLILSSPDGLRFRITVTDAGALVVTQL